MPPKSLSETRAWLLGFNDPFHDPNQIFGQFQNNMATTTLNNDLDQDYYVAELYDAYAAILYGLIIKVLPDTNDASDIIKEIFTSLPGKLIECNNRQGSILTHLLNKARLMAMGKLYLQLVNPKDEFQFSGLRVAEKTIYILHQTFQYNTTRISEKLSVPVPAVEFILRRATFKMQHFL